MDLGHHTIQKSNKSQKSKAKRKSNSNPLKVVYISSPMKVKTSASRFRSLVQHLTGKNSDISQYLDEGNINDFREIGYEDEESKDNTSEQRQVMSSVSSLDDTPTSSDSFLGSHQMDYNVFGSSQIEDIQQLAGFFSTDSFFNPSSQLDVLGSYDELL